MARKRSVVMWLSREFYRGIISANGVSPVTLCSVFRQIPLTCFLIPSVSQRMIEQVLKQSFTFALPPSSSSLELTVGAVRGTLLIVSVLDRPELADGPTVNFSR